MKHEWKKSEKQFYLPGIIPEINVIPPFKYFTVEGAGNPNDEFFADYIEVLYGLSYTIRMSAKKGIEPEGYYEYTVYPLEGIWDISEVAKENYKGTISKDDFVFKLMIRQPEFVTPDYARNIIEYNKKKKPNDLLEKVKFEVIEDGNSVQIMHIGPYHTEPESFRKMEEFCIQRGVKRKLNSHREIYISDPRKVTPDKLKTVLRIWLKD